MSTSTENEVPIDLENWEMAAAIPPEQAVWQHTTLGLHLVQWQGQEGWDVHALKISADPLRQNVIGLRQAMRYAEQLGRHQDA